MSATEPLLARTQCIIGGAPTSENPYSSPAATSAAIQQVKPGARLFSGGIGSVVGAIAFAQLISCIGYYVGAFFMGSTDNLPCCMLLLVPSSACLPEACVVRWRECGSCMAADRVCFL